MLYEGDNINHKFGLFICFECLTRLKELEIIDKKKVEFVIHMASI